MDDRSIAVSPRAAEVFSSLRRFFAPPPLMVVLSGPAGVGKDSVLHGLRERGVPYHFVVTTTDRPIRNGEVDGVDYHFVTTAEFRRLIDTDALIEWARPYEQYKGVTKEEVRRAFASGLDAIMRLDVQGAATIRNKYEQAVTIFLAPPEPEALVRRLIGRGDDDPAQIRLRVETSLLEMERAAEFDYLVVNHDDRLVDAVDQVAAILAAERCRTTRRAVDL